MHFIKPVNKNVQVYMSTCLHSLLLIKFQLYKHELKGKKTGKQFVILY